MHIKIYKFYLKHCSIWCTYICRNTIKIYYCVMRLASKCNKLMSRVMKYAEPQIGHLENICASLGLVCVRLYLTHTSHPIHLTISLVKVIYLCHKIVPSGT